MAGGGLLTAPGLEELTWSTAASRTPVPWAPPRPGPDCPPPLRDTRHFLSHWYDCWHRPSRPGTLQRQGRGQGRPCRSRPWALAPVGLALAPQGGPSPWVAVRLYVRVSYGVLPPPKHGAVIHYLEHSVAGGEPCVPKGVLHAGAAAAADRSGAGAGGGPATAAFPGQFPPRWPH